MLACALTAAALYWVCLRYLFPGYFAPLSAFHGDFYEYASLREKTLWQILHYPRPAAYLVMKLLGFGGIHSEMAGGICIALIGIWLTVLLARTLAGSLHWSLLLAVAIYCALLFAQPDFYFEHRHDLPAEASYLFLICALLCWTRFLSNRQIFCAASTAAASVLFVFSKETFFVSSLLLLAGFAFVDRKNTRWHAGFLVSLAALEAAAFLWTAHLHGPFVNPNAAPDNTYRIDLSPASLARTFWFYLSHLFTPFLFAALAWALFLLRRQKRLLFLGIAFAAAGLAALAPNAVLPNHTTEEYAWIGAPLMLAPILLAAGEAIWPGAVVLLVLTALTLFIPSSYPAGYNSPELTYSLTQDKVGELIARSVAKLHSIPQGSRVLVVGLDSVYVPFYTEGFMRSEYGEHISWTLLTGPATPPRRANRVTRIATLDNISLDSFDWLVSYEPDGYLKSIRPVNTISAAERAQAFLLVPALRLPARLVLAEPRQNYRKFIAAGICLDWGLLDLARSYLDSAIQNGAASDPTASELTSRLEKELRQQRTAAYSATLLANPARPVDSDGSGLAEIELTWTVSPARACQVRVGAPDGKLFAVAFGPGSAKTEKWVRNGMKFYLQDVSAGRSLTHENTLAEVTVELVPR